MFLGIAYAVGVGVDSQDILLNLLFVSNYLYDGLGPGPTGHLWSICLEMQFYFAIAATVLVAGRRGLWVIPIAAVAVTAMRVSDGAYSNINTHLRVDEILSGGCLALYMATRTSPPEIRALRRRSIPAMALLATVVVLWLASSHDLAGPLNYLRPYLTAAMVGLLLLGAYPAIQRLLSNRVLRYIANISCALYLYHPLMASGLLSGGSLTDKYLIKRPITFLLTWIAAHLSTFYWERP